eukprot:gene11827-13962_t
MWPACFPNYINTLLLKGFSSRLCIPISTPSSEQVKFYLEQLKASVEVQTTPQTRRQPTRAVPASVQAKNRRFAYMHQLEKEDYFTEENMRKRSPLLHEQYMGHFAEEFEAERGGERSLSDHLFHVADERAVAVRLAAERERELSREEEFDTDTDEEEEGAENAATQMRVTGVVRGDGNEEEAEVGLYVVYELSQVL